MTISMYQASAPRFANTLKNLSAILDKAQAHAEARKIDPEVLTAARLYPDMFALARQIQTACDTAKGAVARLAGVEVPKHEDFEKTIPELKARIEKTLAFIETVKPAQIDGSEDKEIKITFPSGAVREFTGQSLLLGNSLPNFYFHCTTAYDILRQCGIELGKRDFMGTPVSL